MNSSVSVVADSSVFKFSLNSTFSFSTSDSGGSLDVSESEYDSASAITAEAAALADAVERLFVESRRSMVFFGASDLRFEGVPSDSDLRLVRAGRGL